MSGTPEEEMVGEWSGGGGRGGTLYVCTHLSPTVLSSPLLSSLSLLQCYIFLDDPVSTAHCLEKLAKGESVSHTPSSCGTVLLYSS